MRDAEDRPRAHQAPQDVGSAIPECRRHLIKEVSGGTEISGLYLASYFDWYRLLRLGADGRYRLILWKVDDLTHEALDVRDYKGRYSVSRTPDGDKQVTLDFGRQSLVNGGDANDETLLFMRSGERRYLLRSFALNGMAFDIREHGTLGSSNDYLFDVTMASPFGEEPYEGRAAPAVADLPRALARLVTADPLTMHILQVDDIDAPEEFEENRKVMCTLSLGARDGLYLNMPVFSDVRSGKSLKGWVWQMDPSNCRAGIGYDVDDNGRITLLPAVGDVLTTQSTSSQAAASSKAIRPGTSA